MTTRVGLLLTFKRPMTTTITATPIPPRDGNFCTVCGLDGADVKIKPCDCMVHIVSSFFFLFFERFQVLVRLDANEK